MNIKQNNINNIITDNYNNKEYQTILTTEGELEDLKEQLKYPENFYNGEIRQIVQNKDLEKTEAMIMYETGKVIVFNYVTGEIIYDNGAKADSGLIAYITQSIANIWLDYEDKQIEYEQSLNLVKELEKRPISSLVSNEIDIENNAGENAVDYAGQNVNNVGENSSASAEENISNRVDQNNNYYQNNEYTESNSNVNGIISNNNVNSSNTNNDYITVYNPETGKYEVFSETEIIESDTEKPVSENEKIQEKGLKNLYNYKTEEKTKINGTIVIAIIVVIIIISLIILRRYLYLKKKQKKH